MFLYLCQNNNTLIMLPFAAFVDSLFSGRSFEYFSHLEGYCIGLRESGILSGSPALVSISDKTLDAETVVRVFRVTDGEFSCDVTFNVHLKRIGGSLSCGTYTYVGCVVLVWILLLLSRVSYECFVGGYRIGFLRSGL